MRGPGLVRTSALRLYGILHAALGRREVGELLASRPSSGQKVGSGTGGGGIPLLSVGQHEKRRRKGEFWGGIGRRRARAGFCWGCRTMHTLVVHPTA